MNAANPATPAKAPPFTVSAEAVRLVAEIAALVERFAIRIDYMLRQIKDTINHYQP